MILFERMANNGEVSLHPGADPSKLDLLPRLRREMLETSRHQDSQQASARDNLSARLQRMRIEDRRRQRNEQIRREKEQARAKGGQGPSSPTRQRRMRATDAALLSNSSSALSASARAGLSFYASNGIAKQERAQNNRENDLRRTFAGPIPPGSWRKRQENEQERPMMVMMAADQHGSEEHASAKADSIDRHKALEPVRFFFPSEKLTTHGNTAQNLPLSSLVDTTLTAMIIGVCESCASIQKSGASSERDDLITDLSLVPPHLKERALALSGRLAQAPPLSEAVLDALLITGNREESETVLDAQINLGHRNDEEDDHLEKYDTIADSWDATSGSEAGHSRTAIYCLDLSFTTASTNTVRSLFQSSMLNCNSLRALSFAGWGQALKKGSPIRCLRSSSRLFQVLDKLTNLEVLSLAKTRLLRPEEEGDENEEASSEGVLTAAMTSEALAFLRKLARRTTRLRVLDLSSCNWINGAVIANLGWYTSTFPVRRSLWTRLEQLVLWSCSAFAVPIDEEGVIRQHFVGTSQSPSVSPAFAGKWHAAHHGISRYTDSPYFLDHRPGLGRALLAHCVGAWDLAGRRGLVEKEVAALIRHRDHGTEHFNRVINGAQPLTDNDDRTSWAFSDGSTSSVAGSGISSAAAEPPKCPVSGQRVSRGAWERARVLDAVRGRWGSAILGTFDDALGSNDNSSTAPNAAFQGAYISVYF